MAVMETTNSIVRKLSNADEVEIGGSLRFSGSVSITGAATASYQFIHFCTATSSDYTVTLPTAVGVVGTVIGFSSASSNTKIVTLDGNGSETIGGSATHRLIAGASVLLVSDGANWREIGTTVRSTSLNAMDFSIYPGTGDQSTNLLLLREYMKANNDNDWTVKFEPGLYQYVNNRWLMGVRNVTLDAYGAQFQSIKSDVVWGVDGIPLKTVDWFFPQYDQDQLYFGSVDPANTKTGYKISTVSIGSTSITTLTAGEAANFAIGDMILIHGYDQGWGGYPPNMRYFEFRKVVSADAGTGIVVLDSKLQNSYDQSWWDYFDQGTSQFIGAARALPLKNTYDAVMVYLRIKGAKFLRNPYFPADGYSYFNVAGALDVELIDCDFDDFGPVNCTEHRRMKIQNGTYACSIEADKIVDIFQIHDARLGSTDSSTFTGLSGATGVNLVDVRNCSLNQRIVNISPRHLVVENCDLNLLKDTPTGDYYGLFGTNFSVFPIDSVVIKNNRLRNLDNYQSSMLYNGGTTSKTLTVDGVSGTDMLQNKDATTRDVLSDLDIGMALTLSTGAKGGVVTRIYDNGTKIVIQGTWTSAPVIGEVWQYKQVKHQQLENNIWLSGKRQGFAPSTGQTIRVSSADLDLPLTDSQYWLTLVSQCYVTGVKCTVRRAYTGAYGDPTIIVGNVTAYFGVLRINALVTGSRYLDVFGESLLSGDDSTAADLNTYIDRLTIHVPTATTLAKQCQFEIEVQTAPLLWSD